MTASIYPVESRQLVLDLHALLNDLEPARWRDEREATLRQRLDDIHHRMEAAATDYAASANQHMLHVRERYEEISAIFSAHRPRFESPKSLEDARAAWMDLRDSAEPAYEALVASLKAQDVVLPSLRPTNYTRNIFHVASALTSLVVVELAPSWTSLGMWLVVIVAMSSAATGWSMELGRRMSRRVNRALMRLFSLVSHPHEAHHVNSATWYVSALAILSLTFNPLVCAVALATLGLADPAAAIIGKRWGKHRFENGRSIEGTAAFIVVGSLAALITMLVFHNELPLWRMTLIALAAATSGGLTELFSKRLDDNLGIPVSAGAAAWLVWALTSLV